MNTDFPRYLPPCLLSWPHSKCFIASCLLILDLWIKLCSNLSKSVHLIYIILHIYLILLRVTGAGRVWDGSRLWESEPSCLCQLNVRLGEAETDSEPGSSGAERGERRLHGWELTANRIKLSTLIIESNYSHDVRCCRLHTLISGSTSSSQSVYFAGKVLTLKNYHNLRRS